VDTEKPSASTMTPQTAGVAPFSDTRYTKPIATFQTFEQYFPWLSYPTSGDIGLLSPGT
jgi:hypothetical protein